MNSVAEEDSEEENNGFGGKLRDINDIKTPKGEDLPQQPEQN